MAVMPLVVPLEPATKPRTASTWSPCTLNADEQWRCSIHSRHRGTAGRGRGGTGWTRPLFLLRVMISEMRLPTSATESILIGVTFRERSIWRAVLISVVSAMMGTFARYLACSSAVEPVSVRSTISFASIALPGG